MHWLKLRSLLLAEKDSTLIKKNIEMTLWWQSIVVMPAVVIWTVASNKPLDIFSDVSPN